jgi:hypothetical protein
MLNDFTQFHSIDPIIELKIMRAEEISLPAGWSRGSAYKNVLLSKNTKTKSVARSGKSLSARITKPTVDSLKSRPTLRHTPDREYTSQRTNARSVSHLSRIKTASSRPTLGIDVLHDFAQKTKSK